MMIRTRLGEAAAAARFLSGLRPFLGRRVDPDTARERLRASMARREQAFALLLRRGVFEREHGPWRALFAWAGIDFDDVRKLLAAHGLEGTLERLHDAGVFLSLEEFKGLRPIERPGFSLPVSAEDFDNPLSARQYEARTGGSSGASRRVMAGLDLLEHECAYHALFYAAHGAADRPLGLWLPAPPGAVGIKNALMRSKLGQRVDAWFSQSRVDDAPFRHRLFADATFRVAGLAGAALPRPSYVPASEAGRIAAWLAEWCARGRAPVFLSTPSAAVRTCAAAEASGLDVAGTLFVLVGEPFTAGKKRAIEAAGCEAATHYAMVEAGMIGLACRNGAAPDDVHLVRDKIATIQKPRTAPGGQSLPALLHTTLLTSTPKLMFNVESGDYGVVEERDCGCGVLPAEFGRHLHTIRSYEKLTSEGMHFMGPDLLTLLEQTLPGRFGGYPTDYQLVEAEREGLPVVRLLVSPSVGDVDDREVVETTLSFLRSRGIGPTLMAEVWENGSTLEVVRAQPHVTGAGKIQPLQREV
ncbi:MAG: hypothetical protein KJO11_12870 [Gemmatimonadetes bacterium]|nr:hypothetical protein [Gemmatimonadota bacterium]MBT8403460.1 hypothetical protein [Gemmatimonadota bacterium]NNK63513.1 hypothetical protein [Gemmatimonadota bacterium]